MDTSYPISYGDRIYRSLLLTGFLLAEEAEAEKAGLDISSIVALDLLLRRYAKRIDEPLVAILNDIGVLVRLRIIRREKHTWSINLDAVKALLKVGRGE
jgi:hypothetical protein